MNARAWVLSVIAALLSESSLSLPSPAGTVSEPDLGRIDSQESTGEVSVDSHLDTDRAKIDDLVAGWTRTLAELEVSGVAISVVRGDEVLLARGFGLRDVGRKLPVDADTLFYIASSTKSFLALAIEILAEEGRLDLDSPVVEYLPRFRLADPEATRSITLRDLLSHAPGLRHPAITQAEAYTGQFDDDLYYRLLAEVVPRGQFAYSNVHFTLLARIVEAVTGDSWRTLVEEKILTPAAMTRTTTSASRMYADPNVAFPVQEVEGHWQLAAVRKTDRTMHAAGGMGSTANDLATWLRLNLSDGTFDGKRIVSAGGLEETHTAQVEVGKSFYIFDRNHYGLGWYVGSYAGATMIHHFGGYVASRAHVSFLPEHDLGVAVVMNSSDPTFYVVDWMAASVYNSLAGLEGPDVLPQLTARMEKRRAATREKQAGLEPNPARASNGLSLPVQSYVGRFQNKDWGILDLTVFDDVLVCRWGELEPVLYSTGTDRFLFSPTPREQHDGSFEIEAESVTSVVVTMDNDKTVRFVRTSR